ncbi:hypothetical protein MNB_SV-5-940 [hydrothermal vent metagenome]|uniref:Uncharacterized protein n=1 Tax=hydrothermal vent metagenome TaxID=652676 RepID=A0A1W1EG77_9ZZZZ
MKNFFFLEGGYLILGGIVLLITLYVGTRPFMAKGAAKKGLTWVSLVIVLMIAGHYAMTMNRMSKVKVAFTQDKTIICESRMVRKVAPYVLIKKSRGWRLEEDNFVSPDYSRPFFAARCIVE